jgi:hypothetical protein
VIGNDAIELLGHAPIEAAQSGLYVRHRDVQLGRCQRPGECRVGIAVDQHDIRSVLLQVRLDGLQHARRLPSLGGGAHPEVDRRRGNVQLLEEHTRHGIVVVLSGVYDLVADLAASVAHGAAHRRQLHELRPRADDAGAVDRSFATGRH